MNKVNANVWLDRNDHYYGKIAPIRSPGHPGSRHQAGWRRVAVPQAMGPRLNRSRWIGQLPALSARPVQIAIRFFISRELLSRRVDLTQLAW